MIATGRRSKIHETQTEIAMGSIILNSAVSSVFAMKLLRSKKMNYFNRSRCNNMLVPSTIHTFTIVLIMIIALPSCDDVPKGAGAMGNDPCPEAFVFLPILAQNADSAGFLVPIPTLHDISLDNEDIFQHGVFFRHRSDISVELSLKTTRQDTSSIIFSNPDLRDSFSVQNATFYISPKQEFPPPAQRKIGCYDLPPSKTGIIKIFKFQIPAYEGPNPFALLPDRNLVLDAQDALSVATYASNIEKLQEIVATHPNLIFLPIYSSDQDTDGAPVLRACDKDDRLSDFLVGLRHRAEKAIKEK